MGDVALVVVFIGLAGWVWWWWCGVVVMWVTGEVGGNTNCGKYSERMGDGMAMFW